jgi:putative FmdB family regulatory protein
MPTYEYECTRCGEITEEFKPISAPRRQRCPVCRGKVERLLSGGSGILFKGSGFYVNDSRAKNTKSPSGNPEAPAAAKDNGNKDKTKP